MKFLILIFILLPFKSFSYLDIEFLNTESMYNYFSLPNNNEENRIDMPKGTSGSAFRVFYESDVNKWSYTLLYAPLELDYKFVSEKPFYFNNTVFARDSLTSVKYKFNSYRAGVRRNYGTKSNRFYLGGLLKVRDAKICTSQGIIENCYDNIGPVPLLNIGLEKSFGHFFLHSNIDGLYSSKGSAYDANIELGLNLNLLSLSFGVRTLGGGADNDKLINFARFQSYYLKLIF